MATLKDNPNSHLTAKEREKMSFPARILLESNLLRGRVLDFGCGFGTDVRELGRRGIDITGYDHFHAPTYPTGQFDTIICLYVLNVLLPQEQEAVRSEVLSLLAPGGTAYFAVRRDVRYPGFRTHKLHRKPTYQCDVRLALPSILCNEYCEIYAEAAPDTPIPSSKETKIGAEKEKPTSPEKESPTSPEKESPTSPEKGSTTKQETNPSSQASARVHSSKEPLWTTDPCPFCRTNLDREIIAETPMAFAVYDKYPVSPGHALIIPKVHTASYFDLSMDIQHSCWFLLNHVKTLIQDRFHPDGFNIGINIAEAAGQTVMHVHIHVIPRYVGDVADPRGGVRGWSVEAKAE